jgi:hypothetical protein
MPKQVRKIMLISKNFLIVLTSLSLTGILMAANGGGTGAENTARINLNPEDINIMGSIAILQNELMNNQEEEYIILGPDNGYFTGFNAGMLDAIGQINDFKYTGNVSTDVAQIVSSLAVDEQDAEALGTSYGTGLGTAYSYAQTVLNQRQSGASGEAVELAANPESTAPEAVQSGVKPLVRLGHQGIQR